MKHLKLFEKLKQYESYKNGSDYVLPNVSYVEETKGVKYERKKAFTLRATYDATPDNLVAFTGASNIKSLNVNGTPIEIEPIKNEISTFDVLGENISINLDTGEATFPESYLVKSPVSSWSFKAKDPNYVINENTYICMLGMMDGMTIAQPMSPEEMNYMFTTNDGVTIEVIDEFMNEMNAQIAMGLQIGFTLMDVDMDNQTFTFIDTEHQTSVTTGGMFTYSFDSEGLYDVKIELADPDVKGIRFTGTPLTSIEISDDITSIGEGAFSDCNNLTSVTIGSGVTTIGSSVFYGCSNLTSVTIPNSVTTIGDYAFMYCSILKSITIPDSVTTIRDRTFYGCSNLESVIIGSGVTTIGNEAFSSCSSINEIICKGSIAPQIQNTTFGNRYSSIKKFGVLKFPDNADYSSWMSTNDYYLGYYGWTTSNAPVYDIICTYNVDNISNGTKLYASTDFKPFMMIINGEKLETSSNYKFNEIGHYEVIYRFLTPITEIKTETFYNCSSLTSITIPNSVTSIGEGAFSWCESLTSVYINDIAAWCNISFSESVSNPLYYANNLYLNNKLVTNLTIPEGVTSIGKYAFSRYSSLTSITIPESVTSIGYEAFAYCGNLTSVTIPDSVTSIGNDAFRDCTSLPVIDNIRYADSLLVEVVAKSLTNYSIKEGTRFIGNDAFRGCTKLTSVTIPNSVTNIENSAFYECTNLISVTIPNSVTTIEGSAFSGCTSITSVTIPDSVTTIGGSAFSNCSSLTSITIGDSVTSIGNAAFRDCSNLTSVTIGDSVTSIGNDAFRDCSNLTSVTIGDSVTTIGEWAFSGCTSITSVTIPDSVTTIGWSAFRGCTDVTSVTIPNSVTAIGYQAFYGCTGELIINSKIVETDYIDNDNPKNRGWLNGSKFTKLTIGDSVTSIGNHTFHSCDFTSISIPNSVTSIGVCAFYYCDSLTSVTIPDSVTTIGNLAFRGCSALNSITCYAPTAPSIQSNTFKDVPTGGTLHVPTESDYSSWMSTGDYYLGYYNWTIQYI